MPADLEWHFRATPSSRLQGHHPAAIMNSFIQSSFSFFLSFLATSTRPPLSGAVVIATHWLAESSADFSLGAVDVSRPRRMRQRESYDSALSVPAPGGDQLSFPLLPRAGSRGEEGWGGGNLHLVKHILTVVDSQPACRSDLQYR